MSTVEVIEELAGFTGEACLVKRGSEYFVVSSTVAPYSGFETLVFPANEEGAVTDWGEVAGGPGVGREGAIAELESQPAVIDVDSVDITNQKALPSGDES